MTNENQYDINRLDTAVDAVAKIRQMLQEPNNLWQSLGKSETARACCSTRSHLHWSAAHGIPDQSCTVQWHFNKPINYCIEFYATYSINISGKSEIMLYKTPAGSTNQRLE